MVAILRSADTNCFLRLVGPATAVAAGSAATGAAAPGASAVGATAATNGKIAVATIGLSVTRNDFPVDITHDKFSPLEL